MGIGELNIDEFLAGENLDLDALKSLLTEGQSAYKSVVGLTNKNKELLSEAKTAKSAYKEVEGKLTAKGLSLEDLDNFNPNPDNDKQIEKFQKQLESDRATFKLQIEEERKRTESALTEAIALKETVNRGRIVSAYREAAKAAGVADDFVDDYLPILEARGVKFAVDEENGTVKGRRAGDVIDYDLPSLLTNFRADPTHQKYYAGKAAGGSGTTPGMGKAGIANPWAADQFNLTEQTRIANTNPAMAKQLMELAKNP